MEKKLKITTSRQFQTLVAELEKDPCLAKGFHRTLTPNNFKHGWEEIARKLNAIGPPMRDSDGWQKVWRDFKFKVKKKLLKVMEMKVTGSGGTKQLILHPVEEAVANLMQFQKRFNTKDSVLEVHPAVVEIKMEKFDEIKPQMPDQTIWEEEEDLLSCNQSAEEEIKAESYCVIEQTFLGDEEDLPSASVNSLQTDKFVTADRRKRKRNSKNNERQELLEKHNAMQEKVFNEISNTIIELKNILKNSSQHQQKLCEIEEKKLKIMQRRHEREEQLFESEMKLKMLEMKIKTKELDGLEKH